MNVFRNGPILGLVAALACSCAPSSQSIETIEIRSPCGTFSSEFGAHDTPSLRERDGRLELVVSFSPAPNEEVRRIVDVVSRSPADLVLRPGNQRIRALRIEDKGSLVLRVSSEDEANRIEDFLCFSGNDDDR